MYCRKSLDVEKVVGRSWLGRRKDVQKGATTKKGQNCTNYTIALRGQKLRDGIPEQLRNGEQKTKHQEEDGFGRKDWNRTRSRWSRSHSTAKKWESETFLKLASPNRSPRSHDRQRLTERNSWQAQSPWTASGAARYDREPEPMHGFSDPLEK